MLTKTLFLQYHQHSITNTVSPTQYHQHSMITFPNSLNIKISSQISVLF